MRKRIGHGRHARALVACALVVWLFAGARVACAEPLVPEQRIELPSVQGRIDHLAVDVDGGRLFVAALGSDSVEVVDLRAGKRVERITSLHEHAGPFPSANPGAHGAEGSPVSTPGRPEGESLERSGRAAQ